VGRRRIGRPNSPAGPLTTARGGPVSYQQYPTPRRTMIWKWQPVARLGPSMEAVAARRRPSFKLPRQKDPFAPVQIREWVWPAGRWESQPIEESAAAEPCRPSTLSRFHLDRGGEPAHAAVRSLSPRKGPGRRREPRLRECSLTSNVRISWQGRLPWQSYPVVCPVMSTGTPHSQVRAQPYQTVSDQGCCQVMLPIMSSGHAKPAL